jgi:hypothetical protein
MKYDRQFKDLMPRADEVWEMKTADVRIFGWMYQPLKFVAVFGDYADDYKGSTGAGRYEWARERVLDERRPVINRQLLGKENMTLRSVAELAWALGWEIRFELRKPVSLEARFGIPQTTTTEPPPRAIPTNQQTVVVTRTDKDLEVAA